MAVSLPLMKLEKNCLHVLRTLFAVE